MIDHTSTVLISISNSSSVLLGRQGDPFKACKRRRKGEIVRALRFRARCELGQLTEAFEGCFLFSSNLSCCKLFEPSLIHCAASMKYSQDYVKVGGIQFARSEAFSLHRNRIITCINVTWRQRKTS